MPLSRSLLEKISSNTFTDDILDLTSRECTNGDVHILVEALRKNTHIKNIILSENLIDDMGAEELASLNHITKLDLSGNDITFAGAKFLSESNLTHLRLNDTPLGDLGIKEFARSEKLQELSADNCGITDIGADDIFQSKSIIKLNLSNNEICCLNINQLSKNTQLTSLFLGENPISEPRGIQNLSLSQSLELLDLSENNLADGSAEIIATQLKSLKKLYLTGNKIGNTGSIALAKHEGLEKLVLLRNNVGNDGAIALFHSESLKELILISNKIDNACMSEYSNARKKMYIDLGQNPISLQITHAFSAKKLSDSSEAKDKHEKSPQANSQTNVSNKETYKLDDALSITMHIVEMLKKLQTANAKTSSSELSTACSKLAEACELVSGQLGQMDSLAINSTVKVT